MVFNCPYCTAENEQSYSEITTGVSGNSWVVGGSISTKSKKVKETKCINCTRKYLPINFGNKLLIKKWFRPKNEMLDTFRIMFPSEKNINTILENFVAITKPHKMYGQKEHRHIVFDLNGERAYVDCEVASQSIWRGLSIERI